MKKIPPGKKKIPPGKKKMTNLIYRLALALILTIIIELAVALAAGIRGRKNMECIALVNVITNPLFNYLLICYFFITRTAIRNEFILIAEMLIVIAEYHLLKNALRQTRSKVFILSLLMNCSSYMAGLIITSKFYYIWNLI